VTSLTLEVDSENRPSLRDSGSLESPTHPVGNVKLAVADEGDNPAGPLSVACNTTDDPRVDAQSTTNAMTNIGPRYAKALIV
jgi:hypothetical protein